MVPSKFPPLHNNCWQIIPFRSYQWRWVKPSTGRELKAYNYCVFAAFWQLRGCSECDSIPLQGLARSWSACLCHINPGIPQESEERAHVFQRLYGGPLQVRGPFVLQVNIVTQHVRVSTSAGVGRTGTFITIDIVLEKIVGEGTVDIPGVIQNISSRE